MASIPPSNEPVTWRELTLALDPIHREQSATNRRLTLIGDQLSQISAAQAAAAGARLERERLEVEARGAREESTARKALRVAIWSLLAMTLTGVAGVVAALVYAAVAG